MQEQEYGISFFGLIFAQLEAAGPAIDSPGKSWIGERLGGLDISPLKVRAHVNIKMSAHPSTKE